MGQGQRTMEPSRRPSRTSSSISYSGSAALLPATHRTHVSLPLAKNFVSTLTATPTGGGSENQTDRCVREATS